MRRGELRVALHPLASLAERLKERRIRLLNAQREVHRVDAFEVENAVVIELIDLPGLAGIRIPCRVRRGAVGRNRHFVAANVIRVRVAAVLVVGHEYMWPPRTNHAHERFGGIVKGNIRERVGGHRAVLVLHTGVFVAEPAVFDVELTLRFSHLDATEAPHVPLRHGVIGHGFIEDASALTARATHDEHVSAATPIVGIRRSALARLVVGMGVYRQKSQCHKTPWECQITLPISLIVEP